MAKFPSGSVSTPKGKGGSNRKLDHPGCGSLPSGVNNTNNISGTAPSGGKPHPGLGSVSKPKNPEPVTYAVAGGKKTRVSGTW